MIPSLGLESPYDPDCHKCKLEKNSNTPHQTYHGQGKKKILIIIEKPSDADDFKEAPLSGASGTALKIKLRTHGIDVHKDCVVIHAVGCKTKGKKDATKKQIDCCSPRIKEIVDKLKPKHIWLFGDTAIDSYLRTYYPKRFKTTESTLWAGRQIPCRVNNAWVYPMFAIDFTSKEKNEFAQMVFDNQLNETLSHINDEPPVLTNEYKDNVEVLLYVDEVIDKLEHIYHNAKYVTFDYETTGLKPYNKGHKILTIGTSGLDRFYQKVSPSIAFPFQYQNHFNKKEKQGIYKIWKAILTDSKIGKVAHHLKFENLWTTQILKFNIKNWHFCTMMGSYVFDERKGAQGLKFVSFCKWGIPDYDKSVSNHIKAKDSNSFNRLEEVKIDTLCLYNGIDDKLTSDLFIDLKTSLKANKELHTCYKFLHKGSLTLSNIEQNGFFVSRKHFNKTKAKVVSKIDKLHKKLAESEEAILYEEKIGKPLDYGSTKDLRELFFGVLNLESPKKTTKGFDSVDKDALTRIDHPWCKKLLELRKYEKINSTYMDQMIREINDDNKIHPFYHLHSTRTSRSSSSSPNSQNMPSRDEEGKKFVKKGFVVPKNYYFSETDYGSQEVRIAACFTKDPVLIAYINDPTTDMHRDTAKDLFILSDELYEKYPKACKQLRFFTKNGFIFPEFYGSYWRSCARSLWDSAIDIEFEQGFSVRDHLAEHGYTCHVNTDQKNRPQKDSFEYHVKFVEDQFWRKFHVFRKWQETSKEFYLKNGYIYSMFGSRRRGFLNQNKVLNTGIQGTAFQCLLWSLTHVDDFLRKEKMKSKIMGQIHDSILMALHKDEVTDVLSYTRYIMEDKIREHHKWLIVPLIAEFECSELGGSWYGKKEIAIEETLKQNTVIFND